MNAKAVQSFDVRPSAPERTSQTDDERIKDITVLPPPDHLIRFFPIRGTKTESLITHTRQAIRRIINGKDDRLLLVVGPCSIHDPAAALDYARRLKPLRDQYADTLEIVMRVYFEKPRTTESQVHRELASGLSAPIGFKNGTDGNIRIATDAIQAAARGHHFLSVHKNGQVAIVHTDGNKDCHVILRGGKTPNYDAGSVNAACQELAAAKLPATLMVDCSHATSSQQHEKQLDVARDVAAQIAGGSRGVFGLMVESHIHSGAQKFTPGKDDVAALEYGKSITDACIGWDGTQTILQVLADAVRARRGG